MAGYSGTPLARKLGIREGHRVAAVRSPSGFSELLSDLPPNARLCLNPREEDGPFQVVVLFAREADILEEAFPRWKAQIPKDGGLWVAWPKKSSPLESDLDKAVVQRTGLEAGLVDNKVCAIDQDWSGLRFVYRLDDR